MKRNNLSMLADIEQLRRRTVRLEEGFGIEKDEALADGSRTALESLRERSRTRYQPGIRMIEGELAKILARPDEMRNIISGRIAVPILANLDAVTACTLGFYQNYGNVPGKDEKLLTLYLGVVWQPFEQKTGRK